MPNNGNYRDEASTGYDSVDNFKFVTGDTVAKSDNLTAGASDAQIYTVSYIANVQVAGAAGTYTTTLTYICRNILNHNLCTLDPIYPDAVAQRDETGVVYHPPSHDAARRLGCNQHAIDHHLWRFDVPPHNRYVSAGMLLTPLKRSCCNLIHETEVDGSLSLLFLLAVAISRC